MSAFAGLFRRHDPWWDLEGSAARRRRRIGYLLRTVLGALSIVVIGLSIAVGWLTLEAYGLPARIAEALG